MSNPVIKSPYPQILTGTTAPTMTPSFIGQEYYNTADGSMYKAMGTSGYWNWGMVGRGSLSEFNKDTIPGIFAWWKADSGVTKDAGNAVTTWADTINGWQLTNTGGTDRPLWEETKYNNKPGITFDGSNDYLSLDTSDTGTSWTYFTVFSINTTYTDQRIIVSPNTRYRRIGVIDNPSKLYIGDSEYAARFSYTINVPILGVLRSQGTTLFGRYNNDSESTILTGYTITLDALRLGGYWSGGYHCNGTVCEHIIYNASLTEENIQKVMAYLNNKYAIY